MSWIADSLVKLLRGRVDEAAVVVREGEEHMLRFANDEVTVVDEWRYYEASLYLARGKRAAVASFSGNPDELVKLALELAEGVHKLPEDPMYAGLSPRGPRPFSTAVRPFDLDAAIDIVWDEIQVARSEGAERSAGALTYSVKSTHYADTLGNSMSYRDSAATSVIRSFIGDDVSATWASASRDYADLRPKATASKAASIAVTAKGLPTARLENGEYKVLASGLVVGHLMGYIVSLWASAFNVITGASKYEATDLGNEVASRLLTVSDASLSPDRIGSAPFDFEGNPTNDTPVYEKGVLKSFLHNNRTAARLGTTSTGNAAGPSGWTMPLPRHISISAGDMTPELDDALKELKNGVYIHNNWYTRPQNAKEGQFSTVGRDVILVVEDGVPRRRVRSIRIADNFDALLRNIDALAKSVEEMYWWDMPYPATAPVLVLYKSLKLAH